MPVGPLSPTLTDHLDDATGAHAASAISVLDDDGNLTATNVEDALAELATGVGGGGVPTGRTISTTAPLTGGGDLSANRTFAISAATETAVGAVEYATNAETITGTATDRATHPAGVKAALDAAVAAAVSALIGGAPSALDTLNELAAALNDDDAFATTVTNALAGKISSSLLTTDGDILIRVAGAVARMATTSYGQTLLGTTAAGVTSDVNTVNGMWLLGASALSTVSSAGAATANRVAVQAVVDACGAAGGGKVLIGAAGTYELDVNANEVSIETPENVVIVCAGRGVTIWKLRSGSNAAAVFATEAWAANTDLTGSSTQENCGMIGATIDYNHKKWTTTVTTFKALTSNVATITTQAAHELIVGQSVTIDLNSADAVFEGTYTIASVPTTTTFTFARTNANVASTAAAGTAAAINNTHAEHGHGWAGCVGQGGQLYYVQVLRPWGHACYMDSIQRDGTTFGGEGLQFNIEQCIFEFVGLTGIHIDDQGGGSNINDFWVYKNIVNAPNQRDVNNTDGGTYYTHNDRYGHGIFIQQMAGCHVEGNHIYGNYTTPNNRSAFTGNRIKDAIRTANNNGGRFTANQCADFGYAGTTGTYCGIRTRLLGERPCQIEGNTIVTDEDGGYGINTFVGIRISVTTAVVGAFTCGTNGIESRANFSAVAHGPATLIAFEFAASGGGSLVGAITGTTGDETAAAFTAGSYTAMAGININGGNFWNRASTFPTVGSHPAGMLVSNSAAAVGVPEGWVSTTAGAPGTFTALRIIGDVSISLPTGAIGQNFERDDHTTDLTGFLVSGQPGMFAIKAVAGVPITKIAIMSGGTGATLPLNQWCALTDSARVVLRLSADLTTTAWASNSVQEFTLASSYTPTVTGLLYVAVCVVATAVPTLRGHGGNSAQNNITPKLNGISATTGLTDPASAPGTLGAITAVLGKPYIFWTS